MRICSLDTLPTLLKADINQLPQSSGLNDLMLIELLVSFTILSSNMRSLLLCCHTIVGQGLPLKYYFINLEKYFFLPNVDIDQNSFPDLSRNCFILYLKMRSSCIGTGSLALFSRRKIVQVTLAARIIKRNTIIDSNIKSPSRYCLLASPRHYF